MKTLYSEDIKCLIPEPEDLSALLPKRFPDSNKGDYGRVLVIAGCKNMCGAAYLAGKAAYRAGAGLVRIFTPEKNRIILQERLPEAVLTTYDGADFPEESLSEALSWADTVAIGSGLGRSDIAAEITAYVLRHSGVPTVADADALNLLSENTALLSEKKAPLILTPHIGEMARLSGLSADEIKKERLRLASEFAFKEQAILILKDARTVTALPSGELYINVAGNHGMSTGGSGDVLCGIIAGFLGQGAPADDACVAGVLAHALAGDLAAKKKGARSLMAGDLLKYLPKVLASADAKNEAYEENIGAYLTI